MYALRDEEILKPLLRSIVLQKKFQSDGFVAVDLLNPAEVAELIAFYEESEMPQQLDEYGIGYRIGMCNSDVQLRSRCCAKIHSMVLPKLEPILQRFQAITGTYLVKDPNPKSTVGAHQDWTFVDDRKSFNSALIWIPLVDVDGTNGALSAIPGSQNLVDNILGSPSPPIRSPWESHSELLASHLESLPMKAGQALIVDNRTIHFSPPNLSQSKRLTVAVVVAREDARLVHYFMKPGSGPNPTVLLKYRTDAAFYSKYDNSTLARMYQRGEVVTDYDVEEELEYLIPSFSHAELSEMLDRLKGRDHTMLQQLSARVKDFLPSKWIS